jgi:hypothetical protein
VIEQIELRLIADDSRNAAVAQQRGDVVCIRTHSQVLIINQINCVIYCVKILAMKITMA